MTSKSKLIGSLTALLLPFVGLLSASAQTVVLAPPLSGTSGSSTIIGPGYRRHSAARRHTTKTTTVASSSKVTFRGPLHTKKVAPLESNVPLVWVNIPTGVYHYPNTATYGKSENGKYMTEADALKLHYRAAFNNQ